MMLMCDTMNENLKGIGEITAPTEPLEEAITDVLAAVALSENESSQLAVLHLQMKNSIPIGAFLSSKTSDVLTPFYGTDSKIIVLRLIKVGSQRIGYWKDPQGTIWRVILDMTKSRLRVENFDLIAGWLPVNEIPALMSADLV